MKRREWFHAVLFALSLNPAAAQYEKEQAVERLLAESIHLSNAGRYLEARDLAWGAVEQARALGTASMRTGYATVQLGVVDHALGRYRLAEAAYKRGLAIGESRHDDVLVSRTLSKLARLLLDLGRVAEAEASLLRVQQLEATVSDSFPERTLANLAEVRRMHGDSHGARQLFAQAFDTLNRDPKSTPTRRAPLLEGVAMTDVDDGRTADALEHFREAIVAWEQGLGLEHPQLIVSLVNTGRLLLNNQADVADLPLQRAQKIAESRLGPEHSILLEILKTRVLVLQKTHKRTLARELERRCRAIEARQSDRLAGSAKVNVSDLINESRHVK
jgi:tetratricopeptide (TPR) repeat protein